MQCRDGERNTHTHAWDCAEGLVNRPSALNQTPEPLKREARLDAHVI